MRRFWLPLLLAAVALRLAALALPYTPVSDARWYHDAAVSLARGGGLAVDGEPTAYRLPGYPFLLSLAYRAFGARVGLAWIWGTLATALLAASTFAIGKRLYGDRVARVAAAGIAIYPALVLQTGQAMSDLCFAAGSMWLIAIALRPSPRGWHAALAGIGIGLLTLTRGAGIVLLAIVPAVWASTGAGSTTGVGAAFRRPTGRLKPASTGYEAGSGPRIVSLARATLILLAAFALAVFPWLWRNDRLFGQPVLTTGTGLNAYIGHHPGASGGYDPAELPLPAEALAWNEAEVDRALLGYALDFARTHPLDELVLASRKIAHLYALETSAVTALFQGDRPASPALKYALHAVSQLAYVAVLAAFLLRAFELLTRRTRLSGTQWAGWIVILGFTAVAVLFFGQDRFRLPILPWMMIEGAAWLGSRRPDA